MRSTRAVIKPVIFLKCNLEVISSNFIPVIISSHTVCNNSDAITFVVESYSNANGFYGRQGAKQNTANNKIIISSFSVN